MAYSQLNRNERNLIYTLFWQGKSFREIGRLLGRHHTTILREFKRYYSHYTNAYNPEVADNISQYWRILPRHAKRRMHAPLFRHVIKQLKAGFSPDIIAGRLKLTYPNNRMMRVSHETIYRWIYNDRLNRGTLYKLLHRQHKWRKKRGIWPKKRSSLKNRISIHDRPPIIDLRIHLGHWEGDLVVGKKNTGYFLTLTERVSRLIVASKLSTKDSITISTRTIKKLDKIKDHINSITFDNGSEFYDFKRTQNALNTAVYFADPYSSWQRGSNEHANGMLRRYFPKGTDFTNITGRQLQAAVDQINNRPRKILNYRTPVEVFNELSGALTM